MDILTKAKLEKIAKARNGSQVSIFAPMVKAGPEVRKNPIVFKNLIDEAESQLIGRGMKFSEAKDLLSLAHELIADHSFWSQQDEGLAMFVSRRRFERFRLPMEFEPAVYVREQFVVSPLVPFFSEDGKYFVLAISQDDVKLYEGGAFGCREVPLKGVTRRLEEALWMEDRNERHVAFHTSGARTAAPGPGGNSGGRAAVMFHGQGDSAAKDTLKPRIERFLRIVDRDLHQILKDERAPLVLAGVEYVRSIFKEVTTYAHLLEEGIDGNPKLLGPGTIHQRSWPLVAPGFRRARETAREEYLRLDGTGRTSTDSERIAEAALQGRVDTLFVARGLKTKLRAGDEENLSQVAAQTFLSNGSVYVIDADEMPGDSAAAALFRY